MLVGETDFWGQAATFYPDFSDQRRALTQNAANYLNPELNSFALSLCLGMRSVGTITRPLHLLTTTEPPGDTPILKMTRLYWDYPFFWSHRFADSIPFAQGRVDLR